MWLPICRRSFVLWLLWPLGGRADVTPLLRRLDTEKQSIQTLAGEFTQRNRVKLFAQEMHSRGRFFFQRPRRIRFEYLSPDASVVILDGDRATLRTLGSAPQTFDLARDPALRTVFDQLLLWLGTDSLARTQAEYDLAAENDRRLVLIPRPGSPMARAFRRVELEFDAKWLLHGIKLDEVSGDEKWISFTKMERNVKLPEGAFKP